MRKFFKYIVAYYLKFILGWCFWIFLLLFTIFFNLITWNWKETQDMDFSVVITEICGESTWKSMFLI